MGLVRVALWAALACAVGCSSNSDGDRGGAGGAGATAAIGGAMAGAGGAGAGAGGASGAGAGGVMSSTCPAERDCSGGMVCCDEDEECVDGFECLPVCENMRCGNSGALCCDADQTCLDGVVCGAECKKDQAVCGKKLDKCCDDGDVCLDDKCETPGIECGDNFDCLASGLYCEQSLGKCLTIPQDIDCEVRTDFDEIALEIEWHWAGSMVGAKLYNQVIDTPVVGDITGDGIPDVVVPAYTSASLNDNILVAINGADGSEHWTISGADAASEQSAAALANFDDDPELEVVYFTGNAVRIIEGDGVTEIARRPITVSTGLQIAIADLDADGTPDVVAGCRAMNGLDIANAAMDFFDKGACGGAPAVANLDADPEPEVTSGGDAYDLDGTSIWTTTGNAGYPAVADMDLDGKPEVINVLAGKVIVRNGQDGSMLIGPGGTWADGTFNVPGGGTGGPPTVADFDGDGAPEISTAGQAAYVVYDPDCLPDPPRKGDKCGTTDFIRWQTPTQDLSSSVTGSSVFDFQGDGIAEVVYNDECFLHVYNGDDGSESLDRPVPNSSRTSREYPIVVDVDRDGNSEIVVPANNDQAVGRDKCPDSYEAALGIPKAELPPEFAAGTAGIYVYGDPNDRWVGTRPIWNQFTYHITNVTDQGEVPKVESDNWTTEGLNDFRKNIQGAAVFNAPNLTVELEAVAQCQAQAVLLSAVVENIGSRGTPGGFEVEFFQTDPKIKKPIASKKVKDALLPGGEVRVTVSVEIPADTDLKFKAEVDGAEVVIECIEDDNADNATAFCPGIALE